MLHIDSAVSPVVRDDSFKSWRWLRSVAGPKAAAIVSGLGLALAACSSPQGVRADLPSLRAVLPSRVIVQEGVTAPFIAPGLRLAAARKLTWSVDGEDAARFRIDPTSGQLSFKVAPDWSRPSSARGGNLYRLNVVAIGDDQRVSTPITVQVRPWNDGGQGGLPSPPAPVRWPRPAAHASTPGLRVIPWAGFRAAVSYSFDDSQPSQIDHYPELRAQRVRSTFYINPTANRYPPQDAPAAFDAVWKDAIAQGSEIGNHTTHHCRADEVDRHKAGACPSGLGSTGAEFDDTTDYIIRHLGQADVWTAAYPFGDLGFEAAARSRFIAARGVWRGMVAPAGTAPGRKVDLYNLPIIGYPGEPTVPGGDALTTFTADLDRALRQGRWMIYLLHTLLPTTPDKNWFAAEDVHVVTQSMSHAKASGDLWIDSVANISAYWIGQRLLQGAQPVRAGAGLTWTWTLPPHFPTGRLLRVRVDGGRLSQDGVDLPWDSRGFYEVRLDAGRLAWRPE